MSALEKACFMPSSLGRKAVTFYSCLAPGIALVIEIHTAGVEMCDKSTPTPGVLTTS